MDNYFLRKLQNFTRIEQSDADFLNEAVSRPRFVKSGVDLIAEGDKPSNVFLVTEGFACRYKILRDGRRQIMAYLVPGDICDLHVFLLDHMDHSLGTLSDCMIVEFPRPFVLEMLMRPAISMGLLLSTMVDEGTLREWLVNIGQRQAEPRIAHLLCELLARLRSVGLVVGNSYALPLTQVELADTMGMTPVHMNRVLQSLRKRRLLSFEDNRIVVLDVAGLEREAGWNPNYLHLRTAEAQQLREAISADK